MSKSFYKEAFDNTQILLALVDLKELNSKKKLDMLNQIEQALEQAQKQEQEHIEYSKKVQDQFSNDTKRIGKLESKLIRQEKLLKLYKELTLILNDLIIKDLSDLALSGGYYKQKILKIKNEIKELEK